MIKNTALLVKSGKTCVQQKVRKDLCRILEDVLLNIDPYKLIRQNVALSKNQLAICSSLKINLSKYKNIYVVGAGKAAYQMALAMEELVGNRITSGHINVPSLPSRNKLKKITVWKARHPIPDKNGVAGTKRIKHILEKADKDSLILAVISGGGSALMPLPAPGIRLSDKTALTSLLLKTSANLHEINIIRKHISAIKGGYFAEYAYPATVVALYISDMVGEPFTASEPTFPDPSTFLDAINILKKHNIWNKTPKNIKKRFLLGVKGKIPETPKPGNKIFSKSKIYNFTIGNHTTAVVAAAKSARKLGYRCLPLTSSIQGEARKVSKIILAAGKRMQLHKSSTKPTLIIAGGETTVKVRGKGKGGRNQELVLSAIPQLSDGMTIVSFGTDGVDGITPVPVAGAMADINTRERALNKKLNIQKYLANNDSYNFFKKVGDHLHTGPTGTNVGDLILLAIYKVNGKTTE